MKIVKCENCKTEAKLLEGGNRRMRYMPGWVLTGPSEKYPEQRYACWCPNCKHLRHEPGIRRLLPDATEAEIKVLLADIELQELRKN